MKYQHEWSEKRRDAKPTCPVVLPKDEPSAFQQMTSYLKSRELSPQLATENGWYPTIDSMGYPRVVIPASTRTNTWPYYQARLTIEAPSDIPRYKSPKAPRGDALAVVFPARAIRGVMILEGPMDALASAMLGFVGVGLMGNTPGEQVLDHLEHLIKVYGGDVFVVPDKDAIEEGAAFTAKLWTRGLKCTMRPLIGAKDLAEMPHVTRAAWFGG